MDKTENMLVFEKIHNDCREIFKGDRALAEKLNEFNDYLNNHLNKYRQLNKFFRQRILKVL